MKPSIWIVIPILTLMITPAIGAGSASQSYYLPTGRSNDPFVFCTEGVREDGWVAVNPLTGTWTPVSQYVNYRWIPTYVYICPKALGQGQWTGAGSGSMVPFFH